MSNKAEALRRVALYGSGTLIRQIVAFLLLPIYTRYLSPEDYGIVALLSVMLFVSEAIVGARFVQAIPRFYYDSEDESSKQRVLSTALITTCGISLLGVVLLVASSTSISQFLLGSTEYSMLVSVYAILMISMAVESYSLTFIRLQERAGFYLLVSLVRLVIQVGLNVYFIVILRMGVSGAVAATVISSILFSAILGTRTIWYVGLKFDRTVAKALIAFSWPLWVGGIALLYISSSTRFFIRVLSSLADVGLFELASRFASIVMILTWMPFSQWWQTERFILFKRDDHGRRVFAAVFEIIFAISMFVAAGISLFADPVIRIMADSAFHGAIYAIPALAIGVALRNTGHFLNFSFVVTDRTKSIAYVNWLSALILTVFLLLLLPSFGFVGASFAVAATSLVSMLVMYRWGSKVQPLGITLGGAGIYFLLVVLTLVFDQLVVQSLAETYSFVAIFFIKSAEAAVLGAAFLFVATLRSSTRPYITSLVAWLRERLAHNRTESRL